MGLEGWKNAAEGCIPPTCVEDEFRPLEKPPEALRGADMLYPRDQDAELDDPRCEEGIERGARLGGGILKGAVV